MEARLNKYLSSCGLGSRRKVEELVKDGKIKINGQIVKNLSTIIDSESDTVQFENRILKPLDKQFYLMLNKPKGYVTTLSDEKGKAHCNGPPP